MKVFVLFLSLCFVLIVDIFPAYATEGVCTIKANCRTPSIIKSEWMTFATPDDTAKIEAEVSSLKKSIGVQTRERSKLDKEAEKNKEKLDDAMKKIELLNEEVERVEKDAIESKAKMDDAMKQNVNKFNEIRIELAKLEGRLERSEKAESEMNSKISLMEKKNAETESGLRNEMAKMKKEDEEGKTQLSDAMKQITALEKTNGEMRIEMDSMKMEAEEDKGKLSDAMKQIDLLKKKNTKMEKDAEENKGKTEDLIKRMVSLENENDEKKRENGGTSEKETSAKTRNEKNTTTVLCPVIYENKCFIPVIERQVNYDDGVAICKSRGGHLANIYSQTHMDDVMKYIRENRMGGSRSKDLLLGMKYDPKVKKFTFRDGTDAPAGLKWRSGYPLTVESYGAFYADHTNVILRVFSDQSISQSVNILISQYLLNFPPSYNFYVLCEIE